MLKNVLLYPSGLGQLKKGLESTPNIIKQMIDSNKHCVKLVDIQKQDTIEKSLFKLYDECISSQDTNIIIGGDHSMSVATLQASLYKQPETKVLWIDAHADINTFQSSKTNNIHGMPLGIVTNINTGKNMRFHDSLLNYSNVMYLGLRDIDDYEKKVIEDNSINVITTQDIMMDIDDSISRLDSFIGKSPLHISLDVDVLDPIYMPCTGTPVKKGLDIDTLKHLMYHLKNKNVLQMDIAELNLELGTERQTLQALSIIKYLLRDYVTIV